jgi:ubiquinone biosynthesis protein
MVLHQVFELHFFHADLHPGNLIALPGDVIGLIDFGLTDVIDATVEARQAEYLKAVYDHDVGGMHRALSEILMEGPTTDADAFRRDFLVETNRWLAEVDGRPGDGRSRSPIATYMVQLMRLARAHDMRMPPSVLSLYRVLLTAESVSDQLGAQSDLAKVGRAFFRELELERAAASLEPRRVAAWLLELNDLARSAPGRLQQLLAELADGRFVLGVRTTESESARRLADRRARLIALSVLSVGVGVLLAATPRGGGGWEASVLRPVLWGVLVTLYVWIAVLWRRLP